MKFEEYIKDEDALFHYTKKSTFFEYIAPTMQLRLSPICKTNDPREYKEWLFDKWAIGFNVQLNSKKEEEAKILLNNLRLKKSKVASLCSNVDYESKFRFKEKENILYGYQKSRMWSQYGEDHSGICLVFSKKELTGKLVLLEKDNRVCYSSFIEYNRINSSDFPMININNLNRLCVDEYCKDTIKNERKGFYFVKDIDYIDESEFRIVILSETEDFEFIGIDSCLKGILVGDKFPDIYNSILLQIANEKNIEIRKLTYSKGNYLPLLI